MSRRYLLKEPMMSELRALLDHVGDCAECQEGKKKASYDSTDWYCPVGGKLADEEVAARDRRTNRRG
jgi:hypothetical protein